MTPARKIGLTLVAGALLPGCLGNGVLRLYAQRARPGDPWRRRPA